MEIVCHLVIVLVYKDYIISTIVDSDRVGSEENCKERPLLYITLCRQNFVKLNNQEMEKLSNQRNE